MKIKGLNVYRNSESFKVGWVHGFYDCVNDDGARWDAHVQFLPSGTRNREFELRMYFRGYHAGRAARSFRFA
jgi:hypothetical protein